MFLQLDIDVFIVAAQLPKAIRILVHLRGASGRNICTDPLDGLKHRLRDRSLALDLRLDVHSDGDAHERVDELVACEAKPIVEGVEVGIAAVLAESRKARV